MRVVSGVKGIDLVPVEVGGERRFVQRMSCKGCGQSVDFMNRHGPSYPQEALFKFARQKGWLPDPKGKHVCPKCKEKAMQKAEDPPREMTQAERRAIFREIDGSYDEKHGRYVDSMTDQAIATKLAIPRKWVADVREENFGPSGENDEIERVASLLGRVDAELREAIDKCLDAAGAAEKLKVEVADAKNRVEQLRRAFGPHRVSA